MQTITPTGKIMAGSSSVVMNRIQSEPVQEIDITSKHIPKQYVHHKQDSSAIIAHVPTEDIPVIDLSLLSASSAKGIEEIEKLHSALSSWGCFQALNHGISSSNLDKVRQVIKSFFQLPANEKKRYSRPINDLDGYGNDTIHYEYQILDWNDRLFLQLLPEDQRKLNVWPENPPAFRQIVHDYSKQLKAILEIILKAMARSMKLDENCFLEQYGEQGIMQARFNFYPSCPRPDLALGFKPHTDGSVITMVLLDTEVEGLQFLKEDQWFKVPIIPDALIINLGDQAEIMTNGLFKTPVHRVLTNSTRERISLAVFCTPDPGNEIQPAEGLITSDTMRRYKGVKDYVNTYFEHYQEGKRLIDALRL